MTPSHDYTGRVIFITGGVSRPGEETAITFARAGAIIHTSSGAGVKAFPGHPIGCASKQSGDPRSPLLPPTASVIPVMRRCFRPALSAMP